MNSCTRRANDWRQKKQNTEVESQETKLKYAIRLRTHGPRASEVIHRQDGGMGGGRRSSVILLAGGWPPDAENAQVSSFPLRAANLYKTGRRVWSEPKTSYDDSQ
jgi:hypothetical protein